LNDKIGGDYQLGSLMRKPGEIRGRASFTSSNKDRSGVSKGA